MYIILNVSINLKEMTKQELLSKVAKDAGTSPKEVQKILHYFQLAILEDLRESVLGSVNLLDLGQLKISERSARTGINPQTKEKIQIPAKKLPRLSSSRKFKGYIDGKIKLDEFKYFVKD